MQVCSVMCVNKGGVIKLCVETWTDALARSLALSARPCPPAALLMQPKGLLISSILITGVSEHEGSSPILGDGRLLVSVMQYGCGGNDASPPAQLPRLRCRHMHLHQAPHVQCGRVIQGDGAA